MIRLRIDVLLRPSGIPESYIVPEKEVNDHLVGAFDGGELVGCCVLTRLSADLLQLRQMAVRPDQQGKNIGAAVVSYAEQVARKNGYKTVMMHARENVTGFYERCGYTIVGEPFNEVGIGHRRMEKNVESGLD